MNYYIKQQIKRMNTTASFPVLIEIKYQDKSGNILYYRYTNADKTIIVEEHEFTPYNFSVTNGEKTNTSIGNGKLTLSSIDQEWIGRIRNASIRKDKLSTCRVLECVNYVQNNTEQTDILEENDYVLKAANWEDKSVQWTMLFDEDMDIIIPCDKGNSQITSGCA